LDPDRAGPVGAGLLFVPVSRAALNSLPIAVHVRVSAVLSFGRLIGAAAGAPLAGMALAGGARAGAVHDALLVSGGVCLLAGAPACTHLRGAARARPARRSLTPARDDSC
jgi:hypothetical protein